MLKFTRELPSRYITDNLSLILISFVHYLLVLHFLFRKHGNGEGALRQGVTFENVKARSLRKQRTTRKSQKSLVQL